MRKKDKLHDYMIKDIVASNQFRIAADVKEKKKSTYNFDEDNFKKGIQWFDSGLSLDDAPEDMKENNNFVDGFKKGQRIHFVNQQLYDLGREYFEKGVSLEEAPANYRNNEYFIAGYNNNMDINKHR